MGNSTNNLSELLQKYLDGELTDEERSRVEAALESDPAIRHEWELGLLARHAVRDSAIRERVRDMGKEFSYLSGRSARRIPFRRKVIRYSLGIAAGIILVFTAFYGYLYLTVTQERVYAAYYHPYELNTLRAAYPADTSPIVRAYRNLDYDLVISLLQQEGQPSSLDHFLGGMAFLEMNQPAEAVIHFQLVDSAVGEPPSPIMKEASDYYLGLAYLGMKDYTHSLQVFESIESEADHPYREVVDRSLLRKLRVLRWKN